MPLASQFTRANTEYLSSADTADLSVADIEFCFAAWVYLDSEPAAGMTVISKNTSGTNREYRLTWNNTTQRFNWQAFDSGGTSIGTADATTFGATATATWYFLYCYHDPVANTLGLSVNNGTINTVATTGVPADTTSAFGIGADAAAATWDGRIDEVAMWKNRLLHRGAELPWLYNNSNGIPLLG